MWSRHSRSGITSFVTKPWAPYLGLVLITLFAASLRFYKLGEWSFWIDEIYTINHATRHFGSPALILNHVPPLGRWIPLSVIFTAQALNFWGVNEWSARLVSAAVGVLALPVLYIPLRKVANQSVTLLALLLLAISTWHIFWSQNARFYTSLLLFYSLALFFFYFAIEQDRPLYFIGFYALFYLALSERILAVLILPVVITYLLAVWILPFKKPAGFRLRNLLIVSAPVIAFLLYELFLLVTTGELIFASDVEMLAAPIDTPLRLLIVTAFNIGIPVVCLAVFSGVYFLRQQDRRGFFLLIAAALPLFLVTLANPFVFTVERYVFMTLLFWMALAASGVEIIFSHMSQPGRVLAFGVLLVLLADAAGSNLMYYQINHGDRLEWRETVRFVRERKQDGDIVVSTRAPLASHYLGENVLDFPGLLPEDFEEMDRPIWFIMDYPGVWHGSALSKDWIEKHAEIQQFSYLRVREGNFMVVYFYNPDPGGTP